MSINHGQGDAVAALKAALRQPNRPELLHECTYPGAAQLAGTGLIEYTAATPSWTVICLASVSGQIQLVIEARNGSLKHVCETVWHAFQVEATPMRPRLDRLELIDPAGTEPIARATTGVRPMLRRTEIRLAIGPGIVTALLVAVAMSFNLLKHAETDLLLGGAPALIVALVAAALVAFQASRRRLVWEG